MTMDISTFAPQVLAIFDVGGPELLLIFVLVLLLFGGKRMPELARGLGKSIRQFKRATAGVEDQLKRALEEESSPVKPAQRRPVPATTTPEDTSVYDKAAASAATAASSDTPDAKAPPKTVSNDTPEGAENFDYTDPYEDEYIGGTASSNAGAHGLDDKPKPPAPEDEQKKNTAPGSGANGGDGGGI